MAPDIFVRPLLLMLGAELGSADYPWGAFRKVPVQERPARHSGVAIEWLMRKKAAVVGGASQYCDSPGTMCLAARWSLIVFVFVLAVFAYLALHAEAATPRYVWTLYCFGDRNAVDGPEVLKSTARSHMFGQETMIRELALRGHSGVKPLYLPVWYGLPALASLDWPQPRHRIVPKTTLLPGAIVIYQQPTERERYAKYVISGLVLIVIQALLIVRLLLRRTRERKSDLRLVESEKRFRLMADTTPALVWMCDGEGTVTYLNDRRIDFTGQDLATGFGDAWSTFIHPEDVLSVQTANKIALKQHKEFSMEYRLRRRDGVYRWMLDIAAPRVNADGSFAGFVGSAADITDQKLAQEALEKIGGKLIEAQEEERSRIARELHDDICQRLALLSMELEQANRGANGLGGSQKIEEIRRHCAQIATDVQALSHKLHSSKLEYLGLTAAVRSFCHEFSEQYGVSVQFADDNVPNSLPREISLSLFRVTQEALQNALKHSGANQFSVTLRGASNEVQLEISDSGAGFDVEKATPARGLGLVSMQERVHLVHGSFTIESKVNSGTKILVRVPLIAQIKASTTIAESA